MRLLLDTHTFLWFIEGNARLSPSARAAIDDIKNERFVSAVTLWEIAIKSSIGKLTLKFPFNDLITDQLRRNVMELLPISTDHLTRLHSLPHHHQDPFDRLLAAQSLTDQLQFLSCDTAFDDYGVARLW